MKKKRTKKTGRLAERPILLVFSDDWGRHPSSSQQLIRRLLDRYDVIWVNTIGTRVPRLDWITIQRGVQKLISWTWGAVRSGKPTGDSRQAGRENPLVLNPAMLPSFRSDFCRNWNRRALAARIGQAIEEANPDGKRRVIGITTLPYVADLIGCLPVDRWVYYCVDDWSVWPGMDAEPLARLEKELLTKVDSAIAASRALQDRIMAVSGRAAALLTHGFDERFLLVNGEAGELELKLLDKWPGRKIVYWGLSDERLDGEIIAALSKALPGDSLVFAGPQAQPPEIMFRLKNVCWQGIVPFEQLPGIAQEAAVLIMPYTDSPVTRQIQPLKMLEYLATGKPVVARNLPAMQDWLDCLDVADSAEGFVRLVVDRLNTGTLAAQRVARERIREQPWERKAAEFEELFR